MDQRKHTTWAVFNKKTITELSKLKKWLLTKRHSIILILEGDRSSGRSLLAEQLMLQLGNDLVNLVSQQDLAISDQTHNYQQLLTHLPTSGGIVIFDGCWLQDVNSTTKTVPEALSTLEKFLQQAGHTVLKYWFRKPGILPLKRDNFISVTEHSNGSGWQKTSNEDSEKLIELILSKVPYQDLTFSGQSVNLPVLRQRAYNLRWATVESDVIPLTAADPDFPVAVEIEQAINRYTKERIFSYGPPEGLPQFKRAVANTLQNRKHIPANPGLILPVDGAASGMFTTARFALQPGDEAIIFDPVDFLFQQAIQAAGGKVIRVPLNTQTGTFDPDELANLVTNKTRMIGVCNPHNPLGRVLRREEVEFIGQLAVEHDLWILNDEVWSDIIYSPFKHTSMATLDKAIAKRTISVFGFSKTFGLAGLRVGFILAPDPAIYQGLLKASKVSTTAAGVTTLSQIAATAAYEECWYWADAFIEHLSNNRNYAVERLNRIPGIEVNSPEGTYVLFVNITGTGKDSQFVTDYLQKEAKVSVVPGLPQWFGPRAEGHIRLCFSTSREIIAEAIDRIEMALQRL